MTIQSDTVGNKFLGDCIYANHSITYPSTNFLQAHSHSSISAELAALFTASGMQFRNILSQSSFNTTNDYTKWLFAIAPASDSIDDRYTSNVHIFQNNGGGFGLHQLALGGLTMYNDSGFTQTNNSSMNFTNVILNYINIPGGGLDDVSVNSGAAGGSEIWGFTSDRSAWSDIWWSGVSDGESVALFIYQYNFSANKVACKFLYAGIVNNVNTNYNYYNENITTKSILMSGGGNGTSGYATTLTADGATIAGCHRIGTTSKSLLKTGDAQYSIVCSDAQTPSGAWATDLYVFDNSADLGYPAIGKLRNVIAATGTYTLGKVVKIQGSIFPDAGGVNTYLPVGTFAGKTLLMKCYSSAA